LLNRDTKDIIDVFEILEKHRIKSVFKYRPGTLFNEDMDNLSSNKVWASKTIYFNDPYDCTFIIDSNYLVEKNYDKQFYDEWSYRMHSTTCASCFSEVYDSILMWSHYAENHEGFCIEYNLYDVLWNHMVYPVLYSDKILNPLWFSGKDDTNWDKKLLLTKSNKWKYEREWRIIISPLVNELIEGKGMQIQMPKPKAIYMGCKIERNMKLKNALIEYTSSNNIKLFKLKMDRCFYKLIRERIF